MKNTDDAEKTFDAFARVAARQQADHRQRYGCTCSGDFLRFGCREAPDKFDAFTHKPPDDENEGRFLAIRPDEDLPAAAELERQRVQTLERIFGRGRVRARPPGAQPDLPRSQADADDFKVFNRRDRGRGPSLDFF
ncbi:hypothetical protein [Arvimicrobium flavum]|uniref:hypothetical protein n=1 Tax=Arvimicrobium flavum TaxID=3393320 RepID=UPI00237C3AE1|nr:hypothetical protein [Mesorhizobium shangrilense]